MKIDNISIAEVNHLDPTLPPTCMRISLTLTQAEGDYVKHLCRAYDMHPNRVFRTLLGLDFRSGHIRKEVADALRNATELCQIASSTTRTLACVAEK